MNDELEWSWKGSILPDQLKIAEFSLSDWEKPRKRRCRVSAVPAEIRTEYFSDTILELYRQGSLFGRDRERERECARARARVCVCIYIYIFFPYPESASELYRPRDRRLSAKLVPTFLCVLYRVVGSSQMLGVVSSGFLSSLRWYIRFIISCDRRDLPGHSLHLCWQILFVRIIFRYKHTLTRLLLRTRLKRVFSRELIVAV
jgi:hypothetical protein